MICRLDQQDFIPFKDELKFARGPKLKLWLKPRGKEDSCSLKAEVSISRQHWPQSESTIDMELSTTIHGNSNFVSTVSTYPVTKLEQTCCHTPQVIFLHNVVPHNTITHQVTDSSLLFTITAKLRHSHFSLRISNTGDKYLNIDFTNA